LRTKDRNLIALLILLALAGAGAAAQTVSVAPAEDPALSAEGKESPSPMASLVSGCLESLFEAGMIATDARCVPLTRGAWESPSFGLAEAGEGFVDYVVALYASWKPSAYKPGAWLATKVEYRLVRVADGSAIATGSLEGPGDSERSASEAERSAERIGASIGRACAASLGSRSVGGK
jgi:hypothetical protein